MPMPKNPIRMLCLGLALWCAFSIVQAADTIKIASLAPDGSLWMKEMRAAGEAIARDTGGRVAIKFYPGGVMGNDATVLRKIRLGQLQGGAFTGSELTLVYPSAQVYSLPFLFADHAQVDAVRAKVDPMLAQGFEAAGFHIVGISGVGFAYLMGSRPIGNGEDLKAAKVWIPQNDRIAELTFRAGGIDPIPLPLGDVFTALQTGLVDTVGNTSAGAIALQWHTRITHVFDLPLTYVMAYVAIDAKAFARLDAGDREIVDRAFAQAARDIDAGNRRADAEARAVLERQGVAFLPPPDDDARRWQELGSQVTAQLVAEGALDAEVLRAVQTALPRSAGSEGGESR
jgi:TRAP-type C4-dicarboxylate transport system substrate-binding protein